MDHTTELSMITDTCMEQITQKDKEIERIQNELAVTKNDV
jgi:hypothetical protein